MADETKSPAITLSFEFLFVVLLVIAGIAVVYLKVDRGQQSRAETKPLPPYVCPYCHRYLTGSNIGQIGDVAKPATK